MARTQYETAAAFERLSRTKEIGCDTETTGLTPAIGKLLSVQFSDGEFAALVPLSEGASLGALAGLLAAPDCVKIFHNAKFDLDFLRAAEVETNNVYCTMIAERVLTRGADQSVSLAETLYRYFAVDLDKRARSSFAGKNWGGVWTQELVEYALRDVVYLPRLKLEQTAWLSKLGLEEDLKKQMKKIIG